MPASVQVFHFSIADRDSIRLPALSVIDKIIDEKIPKCIAKLRSEKEMLINKHSNYSHQEFIGKGKF